MSSRALFDRSLRAALVTAGALVVALAACNEKPLADGLPDQVQCSSCHGSELNAAPPAGLGGITSTTEIGVGAHQIHLRDGLVHKAIACEECHVVPQSVDDLSHADGLPAELTWGPLASANGVSPQWDRQSATCSNYCHGATLTGGKRSRPVWTYAVEPDYLKTQQQATCDGCHGAPPPSPHPESGHCSECHAGTVLADGSIDREGGLHMNGTVDIAGEGGCGLCHGSTTNAAPPNDLSGRSDTSLVSVGAHQAHLRDGPLRKAIACEECHVVPQSIQQAGHIDGDGKAEVTFGTLASSHGLRPTWDGTRCSSTYCHGTSLPGGSNKKPSWTTVDGSQAACGTCHPAVPAHARGMACNACHRRTTNDDGTINVASGLHMNGRVD